MVTHFDQLPQALQLATLEKPTWVAGKLLASRFVARDPLTSRAYFDAVDLTPAFEPIKAAERRRMQRTGKDFQVTINADMIRVKSLAAVHGLTPPTGGGKRGKIVGFSRASRKRLIEFMASARTDGQLLFLTLTYPDEFPIGDVATWNAHMEAFRRRFERRYGGNYAGLWRQELKTRKSGENQGKVAPHCHMMIDTGIPGTPDITVEKVDSYGGLVDKTTSPLSREFEAWALQAWSEIVGSNDERHAQRGAFAVAIRNRRHAYKYISKYVAKEDDDDYAIGRRWGTIGSWDTTSSKAVMVTKSEVIELKRMVRAWMKKRGGNYWKSLRRGKVDNGFTVFGLGDGLLSSDEEADLSRLVYRMLFHAADLSGELPLFDIEPLCPEPPMFSGSSCVDGMPSGDTCQSNTALAVAHVDEHEGQFQTVRRRQRIARR